MESKAIARYIRSTARKARLVADEVRGKMVEDALSLLEFSIKKEVAEDILKLIKSAVANMQNKNPDVAINTNELRITEIFVNGGPALKRFRPMPQGRAGRILKRMCHISVTVAN